MSNESPARILYDENGNRVGVATNPIQVTGFANPSNVGITGPVRVDAVGITGPVGVTGFVQGRVGITGFVQVTGPMGVTGQVSVVGAVGVTGPVGVTGFVQGVVGVTGPVGVTGFVQGRVGITGFVQATGPVTVVQGSSIGLSGAWPVKLTDAGGTAVLAVPSFPVAIRGPRTSLGVTTAVAGNTSSVTLLAANLNRIGATFYNDTNKILYLKLGATASTSSYTVQVVKNAYYEVPYGYTGVIDGIGQSGVSGNWLVTELT